MAGTSHSYGQDGKPILTKEPWGGRKVEIVSLKPDGLADIWEDIAKVARALGRQRQGESLIEQLKARMARIAEQTGAARTRPRGALIEWVDPLMVSGNWMPELVQLAGGEDLFGAAGQPSPWLDWDLPIQSVSSASNQSTASLSREGVRFSCNLATGGNFRISLLDLAVS